MNAALPTSTKPAAPADNAPHLLVVDDDTRIRSLVSRFLQGEGYRVTTAVSARDARGKLVGLIQAPATKLAQLANAPAAKLARVFGAYAAKDEAATPLC